MYVLGGGGTLLLPPVCIILNIVAHKIFLHLEKDVKYVSNQCKYLGHMSWHTVVFSCVHHNMPLVMVAPTLMHESCQAMCYVILLMLLLI